MSVERVNDSKMATEVQSSKDNIIMEDKAIGIHDTQYSADDDSKSFESSFQYQQHIDNSQFEESSNHEMICEDDMDKYNKNIPLPKSIPVGSSDDSCCSDSTESSSGMSNGSGRNCSTDICDTVNKNFSTFNVSKPTKSPQQKDRRMGASSEFGSQERIRNGSTQPKKSKVKFSHVQIREYAIVLGDHPYCDMYPLSLDWKHVETLTTSMEDFEENHRRRIPNATKVFSPVVGRKILKKGKEMCNMVNVRARKLSVMERMSLLIEFTGCTSQQLYLLERKRQLLTQDEKLLYRINASLTLA